MFPFAGMPTVGRRPIGNALPLTYFNRLVRGILLKGRRLGGPVAARVGRC